MGESKETNEAVRISRRWAVLFVLSAMYFLIALPTLVYLTESARLSPEGGPLADYYKLFFAITLPSSLAWVLLVLAGPFAVAALAWHSTSRRFAIAGACLWVLFIGSIYVVRLLLDFTTPYLLQTAEHAKPVIAAIESYHQSAGKYPASLNDLVPNHLAAVPTTGMAHFPEYRYLLTDGHDLFRQYELSISMPDTGFDRFVYWPEGNYPNQMYGGRCEPVGDWVYIHE
jgi:hypothetical protein